MTEKTARDQLIEVLTLHINMRPEKVSVVVDAIEALIFEKLAEVAEEVNDRLELKLGARL